MKTEKALSRKQAFRCERALEPRCRCRCAGRLHGAKRVIEPEDLSTEIPADDPHYVKDTRFESVKHPAWLRYVRQTRTFRPYNGAEWARTVRLFLTCGHVERRKGSQRLPKQVHCVQCFQKAKSEKDCAQVPKKL